MGISVIVTTKNEEKNIQRCLSSLKEQTYPDIEIVVVDNHSDDKTVELAKAITPSVFDIFQDVNMKQIKNYRGAQVNFGVRKSKGDIIFFPDADMTFDKDLIGEIVERMKNLDALYIPEEVMGRGFFGKIRNFERSFYNQTAIDALRVFKREIFEKIGGFDEKDILFGPDDWDLTKRVKKITKKIGITENKIYHHEEWMTWGVHLKKKNKYLGAFESYINKWGRGDEDIKQQFGWYYRFIGVFFEQGKWKKIITHPVLFLGIYFLKCIIGFNFLIKR